LSPVPDHDAERRRFDELMAQLTSERSRLSEMRSSYATVTRSRFHALRMLWFSLKELLGLARPADRYGVWSPGIVAGLPAQLRRQSPTPDAHVITSAEQALVKAWGDRIRQRPMTGQPIVSVVIPVFNNRDVTIRCLESIAESWFDSLAVQFIVVDDGSTDGSADVLTRLPGVDYIRNARNEGFIRACNRGSALARGKYICFLNNDTVVRNGWLDHLVVTLEHDPTVGIAGSKLMYPDGRLQEAGSIVWRDGTGWNYGRYDHPSDPRYNFLRDVDYVSGAALLVRTELFRKLEGFSERYVPAYYEDTDLCFAVRELGFRVVYQPLSEVVHYEGLTSGDAASGTKRYQEINRSKFRERWAAQLAGHLDNHHANVLAGSRRHNDGERILVVDSFVPLYDRESGSQRLLHVLRLLKQIGFSVVFLPDNYAGLQPYTRELQQMGIEVLHHTDDATRTMQEALDAIVPTLAYAWISRPDHFQKYEPLVRRNPAVKVLYDTVDLVHVRKRREAELLGQPDSGWKEWQRIELACAERADATIVVTEDERTVLGGFGVANVHVVPNVHVPHGDALPSFEERSGLLFIGNYSHPPNVDAVTWLCESIMPAVWEQLPSVTLTLVGSNAPDTVTRLRSSKVRVTGQVRDVTSFFANSRLFVAPLRYGAGMKGKIGQALAYRLPLVTTAVGAEGIGLRDGRNASIVPLDANAFADGIIRLHQDKATWEQFSGNSAEAIRSFSPDAVQTKLHQLIASVKAVHA
jgi:O-antigen biosynthesis protein